MGWRVALDVYSEQLYFPGKKESKRHNRRRQQEEVLPWHDLCTYSVLDHLPIPASLPASLPAFLPNLPINTPPPPTTTTQAAAG